MYDGKLKSLYDVLSADATQKCIELKKDCWKKNSFVHIPWEYLGQPINFSTDSHILVSK